LKEDAEEVVSTVRKAKKGSKTTIESEETEEIPTRLIRKSPEEISQHNTSRPDSKLRKKSETEVIPKIEIEENNEEQESSKPLRPKSRTREVSENEKVEELKKMKDEFYSSRLGKDIEMEEETPIKETIPVQPAGQSKPASRPRSRNEELRKLAEELTSEEQETKSKGQIRGRTSSISSAGFEQTEPAEWIQDGDDEDELMIILNTDTYGLENVKEEEEVPEKNPLRFAKDKVDAAAMEELEIQYELESEKK